MQINKPRWVLATLACMLLAAGAVLPPVASESIRVVLMDGYSWFCHQIPGRSFHVDGHAFALCHRCTGIVFGLVAGAVSLLFFRISDERFSTGFKFLLLLTITLNVIDWALGFSGLWAGSVFIRTMVGASFGIVAGYAFARAISVPAGSTFEKVSSQDFSYSTHSTS